MGRYYWGDIEGKFWFAVQPSNAADQFGFTGTYDEENNLLTYEFTDAHIEDVKIKLKQLKQRLGYYLKAFQEFFKRNDFYNKDMLRQEIDDEAPYYLNNYADYVLGQKILRCLKKQGECFFDAEL